MASLKMVLTVAYGTVIRGFNEKGKKGKIRLKSGEKVRFDRSSGRELYDEMHINPNKSVAAECEPERGDTVLVEITEGDKRVRYWSPFSNDS